MSKLDILADMVTTVCYAEGCKISTHCKGLCAKHYSRLVRHGDLNWKNPRYVRGSLEERFWYRVRKSDTCWVWEGGKKSNGYGNIYLDDKKQQGVAHRVSYEIHFGKIPEGMLIDHLCHNKTCVNPEHLRLATHKENMENFKGLKSTNTSGYRGVYWDKSSQRWAGMVRHNGKAYRTKSFPLYELHNVAHYVRLRRIELHSHNIEDR